METAAQTCARLVVALEDLVAAEAASLAGRDFAAMVELQERAAPLVDYLATHGPSEADRTVRARITALLQRRAATASHLEDQLSQVRAELTTTQVAQRRVARVAPVYGHATVPLTGQLLAVG